MKVLRWIGLVLLVIALGLVACIPLAQKSLPAAAADDPLGQRADSLARAMERAVNKTAWDTTAFVRWNFLGQHEHLWDRTQNRVRVRWGGYEVYLLPSDLLGRAWLDGVELEGEARDAALRQAQDYFFNDSFWLNAPCKAFDPGVERRAAAWKRKGEGLLVHYPSGGVTPGDRYFWTLDEQGLPLSWNMYVQVLPVQGLGNTWEGWQELYSGALIATEHRAGPVSFTMIRDLAAGPSLSALGEPADAMDPGRFGLVQP
jgi:hypothetical protein